MDSQTFELNFKMAIEDAPYRRNIYQAVARVFSIKTALYHGSGIDIVPSLYISNVVYVDSAPFVADFFHKQEWLVQELNHRKEYAQDCSFSFFAADYCSLTELTQFDLLISQHAGSVGQTMKRFLRPNGILLVSEGPEDAALAEVDPDYELVGTVRWDRNGAKICPGLLPPQIYSPPQLNGVHIPMERFFCFRKTAVD